MRILIVTETLTAGGAETFVVRLANALADRHAVTIAVMHGELTNPALLAHVDARVSVDQLIVPAKRLLQKADGLSRRLKFDLSINRRAQRRWLGELVDRTRPDIVHSHLFKADLQVSDVRAATRPFSHVITMHGDYAPFLSGEADPQLLGLPKLLPRVVERADSIVAVCTEHLQFIHDRFPAARSKAVLIYNGFAPWRPPAQAIERSPTTRFCMASRGVRMKGWAKAIEAFGRLDPQSAELLLVGEGDHLDHLRAGPLPPGVRFAGFSDNPVDWIAASDVGLLPTEFPHESLPTAVMEYLFCGMPVIATDVGDIATMVGTSDGERAGILLSFEGERVSVGELASAMQAYVENPNLRRRHAALAPAAFAKFDMATCAAAYEAVYAGLASRSSTSASH